jgi:hypothetical protein
VTQAARADRQQHGAHPRELRVEGNRQRDGGRAKQEVHELRAVETGLVAGTGHEQQHQHRHGDEHGIEQRIVAGPAIEPVRGLVGQQRQRESQQGRCREIDPQLVEAPGTGA